MIGRDREAEILRLFHAEKWRPGTIATQLGLHHSTVRRVLAQAGLDAGRVSVRPSMADLYVPFIVETLKQYPHLRASRLFEMVKARGYRGKPDHFRTIVARYRPRPPTEAYLRVRTLPGEQGQVDWGHFGKIRIGLALRVLWAFVMVLSWCRQIFLRFYLSAAMPSFVRGHVEAFDFFRGVPRVLLYDNLKSAVIERAGDAIRFHPTLLELSAHYHYLPRPVAPARGNQKGRVERAIRYIRDSFFAARTFTDLDDLNAQALAWTQGIAADRPCPEDRTHTVRELFAEERGKLLALPDNPYPTEERVVVDVGKTPYVRFDLNDYSIPHTHTRRSLVVLATPTTVRVLDPDREATEATLCSHARSWDRDQQIEDPSHIEALTEHKRAAKQHRAIDRLHAALPHSRSLLVAIAERGGNLGSATWGLCKLLDTERADDIDAAIEQALARGTPHLGAVRHLLDRARKDRGQPPAVEPHLPADRRLEGLVVRPHSLSTYDQLQRMADDEDDG
jgi:transposase